jgi:hypothetical protein
MNCRFCLGSAQTPKILKIAKMLKFIIDVRNLIDEQVGGASFDPSWPRNTRFVDSIRNPLEAFICLVIFPPRL